MDRWMEGWTRVRHCSRRAWLSAGRDDGGCHCHVPSETRAIRKRSEQRLTTRLAGGRVVSKARQVGRIRGLYPSSSRLTLETEGRVGMFPLDGGGSATCYGQRQPHAVSST
ncbi:unnamed protein product, partial [Ectocarpus fasciculatus]